jgi:hypothetical protein
VPRGYIAKWSSLRFNQFVRLKSNNSILDFRAPRADLTPVDTSTLIFQGDETSNGEGKGNDDEGKVQSADRRAHDRYSNLTAPVA